VTNGWEEAEFVFVALVPAELHRAVAVVNDLEGRGLGLVNDAVSDQKLILVALRKTLEGHSLCVAFTHDKNFVLFVRVVLGVEGQEEFL